MVDKRIDVFDVEVGGETLVVVSVLVGRELDHGLTAAEREVALDAARGLSNVMIARGRSRSPRTIANQLASIYRKLGVASRAELAALLLGER